MMMLGMNNDETTRMPGQEAFNYRPMDTLQSEVEIDQRYSNMETTKANSRMMQTNTTLDDENTFKFGNEPTKKKSSGAGGFFGWLRQTKAAQNMSTEGLAVTEEDFSAKKWIMANDGNTEQSVKSVKISSSLN